MRDQDPFDEKDVPLILAGSLLLWVLAIIGAIDLARWIWMGLFHGSAPPPLPRQGLAQAGGSRRRRAADPLGGIPLSSAGTARRRTAWSCSLACSTTCCA